MKQFLIILSLFASTIAFAQEKPEGLFINSKAPEFKAKDQHGKEVSLKELRKQGPVVVIFYRGHWCPYCNKELKRFQDSLHLLTDKKASLVAISPEQPNGINKTAEKTGVTFSLLHDAEMKIAKAYQVAFQLDEKTQTRYKSFGTDLLTINGQKEKASLPVPAVYVVNTEGSIVYRFFENDYKKRPSVQEILSQIK